MVGAHEPVQGSEQPLPHDFDADFDDQTSVDRRPVHPPSEPPPAVEEEAEDPTEPRRKMDPIAPAVTPQNRPLAFQQVQALRVAVDPLAPGSKILVVHLLEAGESAGPQRREALLIPADPNTPLVPK
jgi:hypothetical protein